MPVPEPVPVPQSRLSDLCCKFLLTAGWLASRNDVYGRHIEKMQQQQQSLSAFQIHLVSPANSMVALLSCPILLLPIFRHRRRFLSERERERLSVIGFSSNDRTIGLNRIGLVRSSN